MSKTEPIDIEIEMKVVTSNLGRILQLVSEDFVVVRQPELDEQIRLSRAHTLRDSQNRCENCSTGAQR